MELYRTQFDQSQCLLDPGYFITDKEMKNAPSALLSYISTRKFLRLALRNKMNCSFSSRTIQSASGFTFCIRNPGNDRRSYGKPNVAIFNSSNFIFSFVLYIQLCV